MFHSQGALGSVVQNAPKDYDIVFVNQPLFTGGKLFSRFGDFTGHTVQLHEWEQRGVVGLGTYLFSNRFVDTVRLFFVYVRACMGNWNDDGVFFQQDAAAERLARGLVSAVHHVVTHHECSPTRPLGVLFSGGVDSTALLAVARRMNVPVVAATAGWIGTNYISTRVCPISVTSCFVRL